MIGALRKKEKTETGANIGLTTIEATKQAKKVHEENDREKGNLL